MGTPTKTQRLRRRAAAIEKRVSELEQLGHTFTDIAKACSISSETLRQHQSGSYGKMARADTLAKMARGLGWTIESWDLIDNGEAPVIETEDPIGSVLDFEDRVLELLASILKRQQRNDALLLAILGGQSPEIDEP